MTATHHCLHLVLFAQTLAARKLRGHCKADASFLDASLINRLSAVSCSADCSLSNCSCLCSSWKTSFFYCNAFNSAVKQALHCSIVTQLYLFSVFCAITYSASDLLADVITSFVIGTDVLQLGSLTASLTMVSEGMTGVCTQTLLHYATDNLVK